MALKLSKPMIELIMDNINKPERGYIEYAHLTEDKDSIVLVTRNNEHIKLSLEQYTPDELYNIAEEKRRKEYTERVKTMTDAQLKDEFAKYRRGTMPREVLLKELSRRMET